MLAAFAMPHPPLAVDRVGRGQEKEIGKTIESFQQAAAEIAALKPDTIIFITPHNTSYADYFHISPGGSAKGNFCAFGAKDVAFRKEYDKPLVSAIEKRAALAGVYAGVMGEKDSRLDHGVMVPMWFIDKVYTDYKCVRISQSGMDSLVHYRFGQCVAQAVKDEDRRAVLIASGDLSHKLKADGPYGFAEEGPEYDAYITRALGNADFMALFNASEKLRDRAADCGYSSYLIMAGCFDKRALNAKLLSYEGPFGVGYAVASFYPQGADESRDFGRIYADQVLKAAKASEDAYCSLARKSLEYTVKNGGKLKLSADELEKLPEEMREHRAGAFVSLHKSSQLRGCVGTISATTESVADEIIQNAVSAGLSDNRFDSVTAEELPLLTYKVDILGDAEDIDSPAELDVERYGVIVTSGRKRGLLLPNLDGVDTVKEQIAIARRKAGINNNEKISLQRFEVTRHD
ncbi:MAG: AmmeMemoRadiSam system protein A [Clostridiales bacterium]|jgi:AmmeMemoRadiSam system protein A|nr:AmmeMemoRadiSam system protein A [Clostridiales bacterium]